MCNPLGLGLDLCEIARMEVLLQDERFLERYFTQGEAAYIRSRGASAAQTMAGIWAAKEAVFKAAGTGISGAMKDVEIIHDEQGAPLCRLHGQMAQKIPGNYLLSITHEGGMAAAVCLRMWIKVEKKSDLQR